MLKKAIPLILLAVPPFAWAFVKPVRVLAPQLEGLTCVERVCVDDPARRADAVKLYQEALETVQASVGVLQSPLAGAPLHNPGVPAGKNRSGRKSGPPGV